MLKQVVATELQIERDNCNFDKNELANVFYTPEVRVKLSKYLKDMTENPGFANTHKFYEYTADEVQQNYVQKLLIAKKLYENPKMNGAFTDYGAETYLAVWNITHIGQNVAGLHCSMFH